MQQIRIGITGGIGSGKSVICKIFSLLKVPIYNSDRRAKEIIQHNSFVVKSLKEKLGKDIYLADGCLNKEKMSSLIFSSPEHLAFINALVHPLVAKDWIHWSNQQYAECVIQESALIFEAKMQQYFDYIIGVTAPENIRIKRIVQRSQLTPAQVQYIMRNQMPETEKMAQCNAVIYNDNQQSIIQQVWNIYNKIIQIHKSY